MDWVAKLIIGAVVSTASFVGITANAVNLFTSVVDRGNVFLGSVAIGDLLINIMGFTVVLRYMGGPFAGHWLCMVQGYLNAYTTTASLMSLTLAGVSHWLALTHRDIHRWWLTPKLACLLIGWMIVTAVFGVITPEITVNVDPAVDICYSHRGAHCPYTVVMTANAEVLPMVLSLAVYTRIYIVAYRRPLPEGITELVVRSRAVVVLFSCYVCLQIPCVALGILVYGTGYPNYLLYPGMFGLLFNAVVSPFVLGTMHPQFEPRFRRIFLRWGGTRLAKPSTVWPQGGGGGPRPSTTLADPTPA